MSRTPPLAPAWTALALLAVACGKPTVEVPPSPTPAASALAAPASASAPSPTTSAMQGPRSTVTASGSSSSSTAPAGCPAEMAHIGRFCVDRWEATLVVDTDAGTTQPHPHWQVPDPALRFAARSAPGEFPQGHVSRPIAAAACERAGKRLCSLREWHRACAGPTGLTYPYGREGQRAACNTAKTHLLGQLFGNDPRGWKYDEHFNSPELLRTPGFLARTGEHARCVSAEGVHDLVGNLHEWVADAVDHELPSKIDLNAEIARKIPKNYGHGIFMGGFFSTTSEHGRGCLFLTPGHEPTYHDYSTGFRCCRDADPTSAPRAG